MTVQKTFDEEEQYHRVPSKIKCEICGREFEQITWNHLRKHDITEHEYKEQFPDASLVSEGLKRKLLEKRKQLENRDISTILKREREQDIRNEIEIKATIEREYMEFVERCKLSIIRITPLLNEVFDWHHVDKNHVVAAPRKLHRSIRHTLSRGQSMIMINKVINYWYKTNCGFEFLPLNEETLKNSLFY